MNKKNLLKIVLDIGMMVVLALMYSKMAINLTFHELGGLILLGVFVIHILINHKWVSAITKKLFNKSIPLRTKFAYAVNLCLLIVFLLVGISGIFISKILFHISTGNQMVWRTVHYTSAALALILIGIHLGLHYHFLTGMFKKIIPLPQKIGKGAGLALTCILFIYGCYSLSATSFINWLTMPFTAGQAGGNIGGHGDFNGERTNNGFNKSQTGDKTQFDGDSGNAGNYVKGDANNGNFKGEMPGGNSSVFLRASSTFINYFSIVFVFAGITTVIDLNKNKFKRKPPLISQEV